MWRLLTLIFFATTVVLPPAVHASGSLLSGYGGPGNGEQAVLGSTLVGSAKGGAGTSGGSPPSTRQAATSSLHAPAPAATSPAPASKPLSSRRSAKPTTGRHRGRAKATRGTAGATSAITAPAAAPRVVAYPTRTGGAGALLDGTDLTVALLGIAALVLVGFGLRRLPAASQVPSP